MPRFWARQGTKGLSGITATPAFALQDGHAGSQATDKRGTFMNLRSLTCGAQPRAGRHLRRLACLVAAAASFGATAARAVEEAEAAKGPPYNIAVFVNSRADACYDPGDIGAVRRLTARETQRINRHGGVFGRPVDVVVYDGARDEQKTIANVRRALADPQLLGMVGISNSQRGKAVFDAVGDSISKSGVPFISDLSVNSIFEPFKNVYTTRASQDDDSIPVIARFAQEMKFKRAVFVGAKDAVYSTALGDGLEKELGAEILVGDWRLARVDGKLKPDDVLATASNIKDKQADLLFLNVGNAGAVEVIKALTAAGSTPAIFLGGRIESLPPEIANSYPNAIYRLAWDQPPEVYNDRLRKLITPENTASWIFEGAKNAKAPGWASGECKARPDADEPDPLAADNMRAIGIGGQYADMVGLIARAARSNDAYADIQTLRTRVLSQLQNVYAAGRSAYKGSFDNWSFVPSSRAAARDPFIIILPQGLGRTQLAQVQFVRSKDSSLRPMQTLYVDVDLIKAHRIDENEKAFFAEFYLAMRDSKIASLDNIEFANAYLDPSSGGGRQITIDTVHAGGKSDAYPETMKIYKVSGRFLFDPHLKNYPFDTQRFSIDLQPKSGDQPFIVQPPPLELRNKIAQTDGWVQKSQYVGYDKDFVPVVDAFTLAPSVVPFYKTSFVWLLQRETTDYLLRVAVPLGFILMVAYLSIFIPRSNFEAIVTIQVTALLSAVALYLSLPKLDSDTATLSDRMFVFAYLVVSVMIFISILRVNPRLTGTTARAVLKYSHIVLVPASVIAAAYYVYMLGNTSV